MKLILYVDDTDKAIEAVVASRSMGDHQSNLIGVRMASGTLYSVERRRTGTTETLTVRQQENEDEG